MANRYVDTTSSQSIGGVKSFTEDVFINKQLSKISIGNQGSDGDVHFGASGAGVPLNGAQEYGFYAAHNAYRDTDGF